MLFLDAGNDSDDETNLDEMDQDENDEYEKRFNLLEQNYFKACRLFKKFGTLDHFFFFLALVW